MSSYDSSPCLVPRLRNLINSEDGILNSLKSERPSLKAIRPDKLEIKHKKKVVEQWHL
jgi:hypothetical protein